MDELIGTVEEPHQTQLTLIGTSRGGARCFVSVMWTFVMPSNKFSNKADPRFTRRTALFAVAATIPGPMLAPAQAREEPEVPEAATHRPTYRETEHIRTFYDRSRF
jgi:hypothetical protein